MTVLACTAVPILVLAGACLAYGVYKREQALSRPN